MRLTKIHQKKLILITQVQKLKKLFYHNGYAVFALMEDGSLYAWGRIYMDI